jgi:hypothetical protein
MSLIQKIPLQPETTDQLVSVELDGNPYILRVLWNERFGYFTLSIMEANESPLLTNVKMVKNYPLIGRFKNELLPFGDLYFIQEKGSSARPGYSDLGVTFGLYYYEADAVVTAQPVRQQIGEAVIGTVWDSGLSTWDTGSTLWDQ